MRTWCEVRNFASQKCHLTPELALRSVQEPIKVYKGPNFCNDACCCQTEWN